MENSKITVRYAKALFELALEKKVLEKVKTDAELILSLLVSEKKFFAFLSNPTVKTEDKKLLFKKVFGKNWDNLTYNFLNLVFDKKRELFLTSMFRDVISFYYSKQGIKKVSLVTASTIDTTVKRKIGAIIKEKLNSEIELIESVQPEILGGFILNIDDKQIDGSVTTQLKTIKQQFINKTV